MTNQEDLSTAETLSDEELKKAIEGCESEQIHIPGSIQPHGYLLVLDSDYQIRKFSENFIALVQESTEEICKKKLSEFISADTLEELQAAVLEGSLNPIRYVELTLTLKSQTLNFNAIMHKSGDYFILELEPGNQQLQPRQKQDFYQDVMQFSVELQRVQNQSILYEFVVAQIRKLTGFDRVKLYKFDEQYNGEILAESKALYMTSYLGLHFPASDIPKQARALYSKNYMRLIPNTSFQPSAILPNDLDQDSAPIDLSFSCLRTVSPVHIEYLNNMGINASMSISVMQNGRLWGLIACHHNEPHYLAYPVRMAAELMAHTFSAFLSNFMQYDQKTEGQSRKAYIRELRSAIAPNTSLMSLLKSKHEILLRAVGADGVYVHIGGKDFTFGLTPEVSFSQKLIQWLEKNSDDQIFVSNSISRDTGLVAQGQSIASGAVAIPVSSSMSDYMIWFRQEKSNEVHWAGKPEKKASQEKSGFRLTPRSSFALWKEKIRGFSIPWSAEDLDAANNISKLLLNKKYEDSLKQADYDLQSILDNSSALVYITDTEGRILKMNDSYLDILDLEHEDAVGKHYSTIFEDTASEIINSQQVEVLNTQKSMTFNSDFTHKALRIHLITVNFPLYDSSDDVYALCSISTDISNLKKTQINLERSNKELERVAFVASHDLQEPIRMIANFSQLLKDEYLDKKLDDTAKDYVNFTLHSAERMRLLIQDLLQYSRIENSSDQPEPIDTSAEIQNVLQQVRLANIYPDAEITIENEIPSIVMKPEHFNCIMQNLVANALKYGPTSEPAKVKIACEDAGQSWIFSVADNGLGIKKQYYEKIFEVFQRLHSKSEYEGSGIGLALCARIIARYDGSIWVESAYGEGSTFFFKIPKLAKVAG